jgi:hypothetical protein
MTDPVAETLDVLAPTQAFSPDWDAVLLRAGISTPAVERPGRRLLRPRTLVLVGLIVVAILVPLTTVGATDNWWFLRFPLPGGTSPVPTNTTTTVPSTTTTPSLPAPIAPSGQLPAAPAPQPVVVRTGSWNGKDWEMEAFVGTGGDLCFGVAPDASAHGNGAGAALSCARLDGVPLPAGAATTPLPLEITYLMSSGPNPLPAYIVGPVIGTARTVVIYFSDGEILRTDTFAAPSSLGSIRFFATQIPDAVATRYRPTPPPGPGPAFTKIVGLDSNGNVVACLRMPVVAGGSPLSACT